MGYGSKNTGFFSGDLIQRPQIPALPGPSGPSRPMQHIPIPIAEHPWSISSKDRAPLLSVSIRSHNNANSIIFLALLKKILANGQDFDFWSFWWQVQFSYQIGMDAKDTKWDICGLGLGVLTPSQYQELSKTTHIPGFQHCGYYDAPIPTLKPKVTAVGNNQVCQNLCWIYLHLYIVIYIYTCVCMCVCVHMQLLSWQKNPLPSVFSRSKSFCANFRSRSFCRASAAFLTAETSEKKNGFYLRRAKWLVQKIPF